MRDEMKGAEEKRRKGRKKMWDWSSWYTIMLLYHAHVLPVPRSQECAPNKCCSGLPWSHKGSSQAQGTMNKGFNLFLAAFIRGKP